VLEGGVAAEPMPERLLTDWRSAFRAVARIALAAGIAITAAGRAAPGQAVPSPALAGTITDADAGTPLADVTVLVPGTLLRAQTGSDGRYRIADVSPGVYSVQALRIGYQGVTIGGVSVAKGEAHVLDIAMKRSFVELNSVVVTANRGESRPSDVPASIVSLPRSEIIDRGAYQLDQALPFVPGVVFNDQEIDIRGSTGVTEGIGSRVLVLLDGHPVLSADGAEVDFKAVPILDVDRVEVIKGAYSALYGGNALGGVVNIITTPIADQPQTLVDAHYGSYDTPPEFRYTGKGLTDAGFEVQHARRIGDLGARFVIGREASTGFRQDDQLDQWLMRTKLMYPADAAHPSSFYAVWSNERSGNFFSWADPSEPYVVDPHHARDYQWYDKLSIGANVIALASQTVLAQVSPYFDYNNSSNHFYQDTVSAFQSLNPRTPGDSALDRDRARSDTLNMAFHRAAKYGANVQVSFAPQGRQSMIVGAEESATSIQADALASVPQLHDWGVYAQDAIAIARAWTATLGGRVDSHTSTGSAETVFSPKAGIVFRASDDLSLRLAVTRGYRAPSAIEQFVNQYQQNVHVVPNLSLRGETAWSEEVGATEDLGRVWLDGAIFQSDYHNLIEPEAANLQHLFSEFEFKNVMTARIRGLDAGTKVSVVPDRLALALTYLYLDTQDRTPNSTLLGTPLPYRSRHNATGSVDVFGGLAGVDVRYRSRVERVQLYESDPRAPVTLVDVRFAYRVHGLVLQARASNIFQVQYVDVLERIPGAPRSVLFSAIKPL
jgi:outer membrane receptor for ferrienterochelin and colicin